MRQLRDVKISAQVDLFSPGLLVQYAEICGWALAHAHARSGQPMMISGYPGKGDLFDKAVADFSKACADQSEQDHAVLKKAVRAGRLEVINEAA